MVQNVDNIIQAAGTNRYAELLLFESMSVYSYKFRCLYTWELTEYACCFSSVPQWSSHCVWCQVRPTTSELLSLTKPTDINLACQISLVTNPAAPRRADYNFTR